jgi:hypothetical protein
LHVAKDGSLEIRNIITRGVGDVVKLIASAMQNGGHLSEAQIRSLTGYVMTSGKTYEGDENVDRGYSNVTKKEKAELTKEQNKAVADALKF